MENVMGAAVRGSGEVNSDMAKDGTVAKVAGVDAVEGERGRVTEAKRRKSTRDGTDNCEGKKRKQARAFSAEEDERILEYAKAAYLKDTRTHPEERTLWTKASRSDHNHPTRGPEVLQRRFNSHLRAEFDKWRKSMCGSNDDSEGEKSEMPRRINRGFSAEEDKSLLEYAKAAYLADPHTPPERHTVWTKASRCDLKHLKRRPWVLLQRFNNRLSAKFSRWRKSMRDGTEDSEDEESERPSIVRRGFSAEEDKCLLDYAKAAYLEDPHTPPERRPLWTKASRSDLKHLKRRPINLQRRFNSHLKAEFSKWRNSTSQRSNGSGGEESEIPPRLYYREFSAEEDKSILAYAKAAYLEDPRIPLERQPLWTKASRSELKHLKRLPNVLKRRFNKHLRPEFDKWRKSMRNGTDDSEGEESKVPERLCRREFSAEEDKSLLDYAKATYLKDPHKRPERHALWSEGCRSDLKHLKRRPENLQRRFKNYLSAEFHKWRNAQSGRHSNKVRYCGAGNDPSAACEGGAAAGDSAVSDAAESATRSVSMAKRSTSTGNGTGDSEGKEGTMSRKRPRRRDVSADAKRPKSRSHRTDSSEDDSPDEKEGKMPHRRMRQKIVMRGKAFTAEEDKRILNHAMAAYFEDANMNPGRLAVWTKASCCDLKDLKREPDVLQKRFNKYVRPEFNKWQNGQKSGHSRTDDGGGGGDDFVDIARGGSPAVKGELAADDAAGAMGGFPEVPAVQEPDAGKQVAMEDFVDAGDTGGCEVTGGLPKEGSVAEEAGVDATEGAKRSVSMSKRRISTADGTSESRGADSETPPGRVRRREIKVEEDNSMLDHAKDRFEQKLSLELKKSHTAQCSRQSETGGSDRGAGLTANGARGAATWNESGLAEDNATRGIGRSPEPAGVQDPDEVRRLVSFAAYNEAPEFPRANHSVRPDTPATTQEEFSGIEDRRNGPRRCFLCDEEGHSIAECPERRELNAVLPTLRRLHAALPRLRELNALLPRLREMNALLPLLQALFPDVCQTGHDCEVVPCHAW